MNLLIGAAMFDIILFLSVVWVCVSVIAGLLIGRGIQALRGAK